MLVSFTMPANIILSADSAVIFQLNYLISMSNIIIKLSLSFCKTIRLDIRCPEMYPWIPKTRNAHTFRVTDMTEHSRTSSGDFRPKDCKLFRQ